MQDSAVSTGGGDSTSIGSGSLPNDQLSQQVARLEEMEMAMSLMEKDVHEKQDTIVSLRQQIEDVKKINLDLYQKLRVSKYLFSLTDRFSTVSKHIRLLKKVISRRIDTS